MLGPFYGEPDSCGPVSCLPYLYPYLSMLYIVARHKAASRFQFHISVSGFSFISNIAAKQKGITMRADKDNKDPHDRSKY
jgi:hypothetical protein